MKIRAYAKINLSLDVIKKRPDSYHEIKTIMQKISLYDELEIEKIESGFSFACEEKTLCNQGNLIYKAHKALEDYCQKKLPVKISLKKNIPLAAGLAGGSADGAASLLGINEIYNLNLSKDQLAKIGLSLGADFPYMLRKGTYLASGIGEKLEKIIDFSGIDLLIVNPGYELSTKEVYSNLLLEDKRIDFEAIIENFAKRDFARLRDLFENKMEAYAFKKHPELRQIKDDLNARGIALMSGSGPTIFALFETRNDLLKSYEKYRKIYSHVYMAKTIGEDYD